MRTLAYSQLVGGGLVWLLEVRLAGVVHRFSTYPLDLDSDDGPISYPGGLPDVEYREALARLETNPGTQSASMEVVFGVDLPALHRRGFPLSSASAELSMMVVRSGAPVLTYEQRRVVLVGGLDNPQIGAPQRPAGWAAFTITGSAFDDTARLLSPRARISKTTLLTSWDTANEVVEKNLEKPYPIVIGRPGRYRQAGASAWSVIEGTPAYVVDYDTTSLPDAADILLIAGHHVTASGVSVFAKDIAAPVELVPSNTYDRIGQPIAIVDIGSQSDEFCNASEYWVAWGGTSSFSFTGAGLRNPYSSAFLDGAGDVCRWALSHSSIPTDASAWAALAPILNRIKIDTFINDPEVTPWGWLEANVFPLLPITVRRGPDGLYPVLMDLGTTPASAMPAIVEGRDVSRIGPMTAEKRPAQIATSVSVEYAPRGSESDDYQRLVLVGDLAVYELSDGSEATDLSTTTTVHSQVGRVTYPGASLETFSAPAVYDDATAHSFARRMVRESSFIGYSVMYSAPASAGWLRVGQSVALTDAGLSMADQPCEIIEMSWSGGSEWTMVLYFAEDPARDDRS